MCIVSYFLKTQRRKRTAAKLSERFCAVFSADMFFCKRMKMTIGVYATVIIKSFILNRFDKNDRVVFMQYIQADIFQWFASEVCLKKIAGLQTGFVS